MENKAKQHLEKRIIITNIIDRKNVIDAMIDFANNQIN